MMMDDKELENTVNSGSSEETPEEESSAVIKEETVPEDIPDEEYEDEDEEEYDDEEDEDEEDDDYDMEEERLRLKEERKRKKRRKKTHGRLVFALIMVTLVLSVAVFSAVGVISVAKELLGLDRSTSEFDVEIPENSGTEAIANLLSDEGIITNPMLFRIISKMKGADGTYIAGIHKLSPNMTYNDIIETLQEEALNPREFIEITFPEGIRLIDAAKKLEEAGVCGASDFIQAFNSTSYGFDFEKEVKASSKKFYKMEGYFFPDTYQFYLDEDPKNVVKKVFRNFDYRVTPNEFGRMEDIGMSLEEVMTLASIVQAEASSTSDMRMVASVFMNRLNNPDEYPLLQSDPTSNYVREVIEPNLEIYSQSICDAYDTYKGGGLPPGPICNPGLEAINAVLYPRDTTYYYFCSDLETGEFFFAETLEEHEANLVLANLV